MSFSCCVCYKPLDTVLNCSKCFKRFHCSTQCHFFDWKTCHKFYCGTSGEIGVDVEIRPSQVGGVGMFAKRDFVPLERILVEHSVMEFSRVEILRSGTLCETNFNKLPKHTQNAIMQLEPSNSTSVFQKFQTNAMEHEVGSGLFLNLSRINNSCYPNAFKDAPKVNGQCKYQVLCAHRYIKAGEEITINYQTLLSSMVDFGSTPARRAFLQLKWNFICNCEACSTGKFDQVYTKIRQLDEEILRHGSTGKSPMRGIKMAQKLIELYEEVGLILLFFLSNCFFFSRLVFARS
jgi:hypothetical protein